jgi:hypothetical protein
MMRKFILLFMILLSVSLLAVDFSDDDQDDFDDLISEARSYIQKGEYDKAKKSLKEAKSLGIDKEQIKQLSQKIANGKAKSSGGGSGSYSSSGGSSSSGSCSKHVRLEFDTPGPDTYLKVRLTTPSGIYVDSNSGGVLYVSSYSKCIGGRYSFSLSKGKSNWINITNKKEGFSASGSFSIGNSSKSCHINISSYSNSVSVSCR